MKIIKEGKKPDNKKPALQFRYEVECLDCGCKFEATEKELKGTYVECPTCKSKIRVDTEKPCNLDEFNFDKIIIDKAAYKFKTTSFDGEEEVCESFCFGMKFIDTANKKTIVKSFCRADFEAGYNRLLKDFLIEAEDGGREA